MKTLNAMVIALLLTVAAFAQTAAAPASTSTDYPNNFAGGGAALNAAVNQWNGWLTYGHKMQSTFPLYSFTTTDVTSVNPKAFAAQTSVRTGLATDLKRYTWKSLVVDVIGLGDAGTAISGSNIGSAFSGGGFVALSKKGSGWHAILGARVLKTSLAGSQAIYEFGLAKSY